MEEDRDNLECNLIGWWVLKCLNEVHSVTSVWGAEQKDAAAYTMSRASDGRENLVYVKLALRAPRLQLQSQRVSH